jgi:hypothetical protein
LRELGLTFKRFSDLDSREQDRVKDVWGYLSKLWEFCGLTAKPFEYGHPDKDYDFQRNSDSGFMEKVSLWGPGRYYPYLAALNQRRSLQSQIDSIKALINPAAEPTPEPPTLTAVLQIEKYRTAEANLTSARAALEEFKQKLTVWAAGREWSHWGRNSVQGAYSDYDRRKWAEWRQNRKARGIQWKRRHDRQPELDALYQAMRAIEPPFSGRGSMRKLTPAESDAVRMLRERMATIVGEIAQGTGAVLDSLSFHNPKYPYGSGHRPDLVTVPSRKDRARELGSILKRIRTAENALKTVRKPELREAA